MKKISTFIISILKFDDFSEFEKYFNIDYFEDVLEYLDDSIEPSDRIVNNIIQYSQSTAYLNSELSSELELFLN